MGELVTAKFGTKLTPKLLKFDPSNTDPEYQADIFRDLFNSFPQYKAHVAAYVERNYCTVINDEDHPTPDEVLAFLKQEEVRWLNGWIQNRGPQFAKGAPR